MYVNFNITEQMGTIRNVELFRKNSSESFVFDSPVVLR